MGTWATLMALMELTHTPTVPTTTARGLLMPMPGAPGTVDTDTVTVTATAADTTDKPSAVLIALIFKTLYMMMISGTIPRIQRRVPSSILATTVGSRFPHKEDPKLMTPNSWRLSSSKL